jgi:hypothetical protein
MLDREAYDSLTSARSASPPFAPVAERSVRAHAVALLAVALVDPDALDHARMQYSNRDRAVHPWIVGLVAHAPVWSAPRNLIRAE